MKGKPVENTAIEAEVVTALQQRPSLGGPSINRTLFWIWFFTGCLAFFLDDTVQPHIKALGRQPSVNLVAENWQKLAESGGIAVFLAVSAICGGCLLRSATVTMLGVAFAGQFSKHCVGRVRPQWTGDLTVFHGPFGLWAKGQRLPVDSFPSGHAAAAFAMAYILSARWPQAKVFWFTLAGGVALSRTLVDVHFPSDVILGGLLGSLIAGWTLKIHQTSVDASVGCVRNPTQINS